MSIGFDPPSVNDLTFSSVADAERVVPCTVHPVVSDKF